MTVVLRTCVSSSSASGLVLLYHCNLYSFITVIAAKFSHGAHIYITTEY